jgi:activator of 2-hydroxyglutaryl-CoA dehydratase
VRLYAGIDIGSCTTKAVVIDQEGNMVGSHVRRSGVNYQEAAREALDIAFGGGGWDGIPVISTGYASTSSLRQRPRSPVMPGGDLPMSPVP